MWQLQWMLSPKPWKNAPCGSRVPLVTTWNYVDVTASQKMVTKNKTKWELSTLVSSFSLDEWNASTWHHDVDIIKLFLVLQAAPEEHNVIRMLYGESDFCLSTPVLYKISTKANIQMDDGFATNKSLCGNLRESNKPARPRPLDLCSFSLDMKGGILVLAISHAPAGLDALKDIITCGCVAQGKGCSTHYSFYHHLITCMIVCNCA